MAPESVDSLTVSTSDRDSSACNTFSIVIPQDSGSKNSDTPGYCVSQGYRGLHGVFDIAGDCITVDSFTEGVGKKGSSVDKFDNFDRQVEEKCKLLWSVRHSKKK